MIKTIIKKAFNRFGYDIHRIKPTVMRAQSNIHAKEQRVFFRLANVVNTYPTVKLHIGCGPRVLKGWINIDLCYEPYESYMKYYTDTYYPVEIRGDQHDFFALDVTSVGIPLPNDSVDVIFNEDFIEHLNQRDQIIFLAESLRILKKDGIHRVNTPDLIKSMHDHSDFTHGLTGIYTNEWNKHGHLNVLTPAMLQEMAVLVGYKKVIFNSRNHSISTLLPLEYRPDPNDRPDDGNIFADLIK